MLRPYRWMVVVDGENLTLRGQKLADEKGPSLLGGRYWERDVFLWVPECDAENCFHPSAVHTGYTLDSRCTRSHYYTAAQGDDNRIMDIRRRLRSLGFEPEVFKKIEGKSKGVDVTLAKDVLCHAFRGNYELGILVAGDRDYVPLVEEMKRLGRIVCLCFFEAQGGGLSEELRLTADSFVPMDEFLFQKWGKHIKEHAHKPGV